MGTADHNAGWQPCDGLASHPGAGGSSNIPSSFMLQKPELNASLTLHLVHKQTLPTMRVTVQTKEIKGIINR